MATKVEPDGSHWLVIVLGETGDLLAGYCRGPEAADNAAAIAEYIDATGHQPGDARAAGLGYTRAPGQDW